MGDPMDLGGFMQNFVLKNPFQEIQALKKPPDHSSSPPSRQRHSPPALTPAPRYIKIAPKGGKENPGGKRAEAGEIRAEIRAPGLEAVPLGLGTEGVGLPAPLPPSLFVGTPGTGCVGKAHVGSNKTFAMSLKHKRVAVNNTQLQMWLWRHFKHVPGCSQLYSSKLLLQEAQKRFPTTSSTVLSRVVKFSFPHATKVINKTGYYFEDLVRRPRLSELEDRGLCELARKCHRNVALLSGVTSGVTSGGASGASGAEEGVSGGVSGGYVKASVAAVLWWVVARLGGEDEALSARETFAKMMQLHIADTRIDLGINLGGVGSDAEEEEEGGEGVGEEEDVPHRMAKKRRATSSRLRNIKKRLLSKRRNSADAWTTPDHDDGDDDSDWRPASLSASASRVRPSMTRVLRQRRASSLSPTKTSATYASGMKTEDENENENGDGDGFDEDVDGKHSDYRSSVDNDDNENIEEDSNDPNNINNINNLVKIKDEPDDKDYENSKASSITDPITPAHLIGTLRDVAVHRHLAHSGLLERDLEISRQQNQHLALCLQESQKSVVSLQGQLAERDVMLSQLAEDFFDIKRRFEKLSNQFKIALRGTLQSNLNNNDHS